MLRLVVAVLLGCTLAICAGAGAAPKASSPLVVSATGNDHNPCTFAAPCLTFDHAYHVASPGQVVQVAGGTYPVEKMTGDPSKAGASANVVFESIPGQLAVVGGIRGSGISHVTFLGGSHHDLTPATAGITLKPNPTAMDTGGDFDVYDCSTAVEVANMDMRQFGINGSDHITVAGGTVGGYDNTPGDSFVGGPYGGRTAAGCTAEVPSNILITHVLFHDVLRTLRPKAHPDCVQFYGTAGTVVDGNVFVRCGTSDLLARPATNIWRQNTIDNLVIQNNFFTPAVAGGKVLGLGTSTDSCGKIVVAYNTSPAGLSAFACGHYAGLQIVGNVQGGLNKYTCAQALKKATLYAYNVVLGSGGSAVQCGQSSFVSSDPGFLNQAAANFRIGHGSPLTDRGDPTFHPATDIDGRPRPLRAAPDAGAYEWDVPSLKLGTAIGGARMGMSRATVEAFYGAPRRVSSVAVHGKPAGQKLTAALYDLHGGILRVFYSAAGTVVGLSTTSSYYSGNSGLGVGAPVASFATIAHAPWQKCRAARATSAAGKVVYVGLAGGHPAGKTISSLAFLPPHVAPCK